MDLDDLEKKASGGYSKVLLLSHMRGKVRDDGGAFDHGSVRIHCHTKPKLVAILVFRVGEKAR